MSQSNLDTTTKFQPQFDNNGLIPCVTIENGSNEILMVAYMNQSALDQTLKSGEMHYWSRGRNELWHKGATSGMVQKLIKMCIDCDQDCLLAHVEINAPEDKKTACHTGQKSCFYRFVSRSTDGNLILRFNEK